MKTRMSRPLSTKYSIVPTQTTFSRKIRDSGNATKDLSTNQTELIRGKCQVRKTTSSFCKNEKIGKNTLLADDSTDEAGSGRLHCMRDGSFRTLSIILFL